MGGGDAGTDMSDPNRGYVGVFWGGQEVKDQ
jgi:hypothetical protein